jgi:AraC-like DNA-binding protein
MPRAVCRENVVLAPPARHCWAATIHSAVTTTSTTSLALPTTGADRGPPTSTYVEYRAPRELASHVCCVWTHAAGPDGHVQRVLPDGCTDIVRIGGELVIAGPATGHALADIPPGTAAVGVRFGPGAAGAALGVPARELQDRTVDLGEVWGARAAELAERIEAVPEPDRLTALARAVAERLRDAPEPDRLVAQAARLLGRGASVAQTGREVALGERHLRRRFHDAVGYGPKTLQRVLRLDRFLRVAEASPEPDLARAALEAGYYDQPHLTRECKELSGLSPVALLAARRLAV